MFATRPRHLLIGDSQSTWCGFHGAWHRGLRCTRNESEMTCGNCRRSLKAHRAREAKQPKNVTPRS